MFNGMNGLEILNSWPRYESGELVRIGDVVSDVEVRSVVFRDGGILLSDCTSVPGWGTWRSYKEPIKRPAVLAADSEPLEAGQTVWHVGNGIEFTVVGLPKSSEYQAVKLRLDDGAFTGLDPDQITHQRPVLDAAGVPIREGDTVWNATTSAGPFTVREIERSDDPDEPEDIVWCGEHAANGFKVWRIADQLTHTKPEIDSWERVEEDADALVDAEINGEGSYNAANAYCNRRGLGEGTSFVLMAQDLVRRCRALAERERGE